MQFPNSLTYIGSGAFHTNKFSSVTLPEGITVVYGYTFNHCVNLTDVKFGNKVNKIEKYAFTNTAITTLTIPESVTYLNSRAFDAGVILN